MTDEKTKSLFVVEFNYGTVASPEWSPLHFMGKKGPGYNTRICCGDYESAVKLGESLLGLGEKWRVVEYVRK